MYRDLIIIIGTTNEDVTLATLKPVGRYGQLVHHTDSHRLAVCGAYIGVSRIYKSTRHLIQAGVYTHDSYHSIYIQWWYICFIMQFSTRLQPVTSQSHTETLCNTCYVLDSTNTHIYMIIDAQNNGDEAAVDIQSCSSPNVIPDLAQCFELEHYL